MSEFAGTYDLIESNNVQEFAKVALANVISKVAFRTGIVERKLLDLFSKTRCQITATVDDASADMGVLRRSKIWKSHANSHTWTLSVDSSNAPKPPPDAPPSPTRKKKSTNEITITVKLNFKIGEDFLLAVPITGEKVNSKFKRSSKSRSGVMEQTTFLPTGIIDTVWNHSKDNLVLTHTHKTTDIKATQVFRRISRKERTGGEELEGGKSTSPRRTSTNFPSYGAQKNK